MDNVNKPKHYVLEGLEPYQSIDVINAVLGENARYFYLGNIIKYFLRAEKKNGLEDYKKARVYLDWLIEWDSLSVYERELKHIKYLLDGGEYADLETIKKRVDVLRPLVYDSSDLFDVEVRIAQLSK